MEKGWNIVYRTNKQYLADMVKTMLKDNNIESVIINKKDSVYLIGELEVYVREEDKEKADGLIKEFEN
jgi:hypothetical protein